MRRLLRNWACMLPLLAIGFAGSLLIADLRTRTLYDVLYAFLCLGLCVVLGSVCSKLLDQRCGRWIQIMADLALAGAMLPLVFRLGEGILLRAALTLGTAGWVLYAHNHAAKGYLAAAGVMPILSSMLVHLGVAVVLYARYRLHQTHDLYLLGVQAVAVVLWAVVAAALLADQSLLRVVRGADTHQAPHSVRRASRITVAVSTVLVVVGTLLRNLQGILDWFARVLREGISAMVRALFNTTPSGDYRDPTLNLSQQGAALEGLDAETWAGWQVVETVLFILGGLVLLLGLLYLLRNRLPQALRKLFHFLRDGLRRGEDGFTDTTEALLDWQEVRERSAEVKLRVQKLFVRKRRLRDCATDTERLRFVYAQILQRLDAVLRPVPPSMTPLELARREKSVALRAVGQSYGAVRYGDSPATAEQVRHAQQALEEIRVRR